MCFLYFAVPRTEILGDPDRYVKAGSRVNLRCVVRGALEPPTFIMWYHGTEQLSAESRRHITQIDRNLPEAEGDPHSTVSVDIFCKKFKFCTSCISYTERKHSS